MRLKLSAGADEEGVEDGDSLQVRIVVCGSATRISCPLLALEPLDFPSSCRSALAAVSSTLVLPKSFSSSSKSVEAVPRIRDAAAINEAR